MRMYSPYLLVLALCTPIAWAESQSYTCRYDDDSLWYLKIYPDQLLDEKTGKAKVDACAVMGGGKHWDLSCTRLHAYEKGDFIKFSQQSAEYALSYPGHYYSIFVIRELKLQAFDLRSTVGERVL